MICLTDIPPQFAHAAFNYVLGLLMSIVRSPFDGSQELIIAGLTLLWQIIPYLHGPDLSQIPTQLLIIFFGIPDSKRDRYYLIDVKTQQIHIPDTYVRDFYFFRRNIYPQLSLMHMDIKQSQQQLEHMPIYLKTTELSILILKTNLV